MTKEDLRRLDWSVVCIRIVAQEVVRIKVEKFQLLGIVQIMTREACPKGCNFLGGSLPVGAFAPPGTGCFPWFGGVGPPGPQVSDFLLNLFKRMASSEEIRRNALVGWPRREGIELCGFFIVERGVELSAVVSGTVNGGHALN